MSRHREERSSSEAWAHFRFAAVGPLLAAPPRDGDLQGALADLAATEWTHPISGELVTFGLSTIQRWYYAARERPDPVRRLARTPRKDAGRFIAISEEVGELLRVQYKEHPGWTYLLHADNIAALCRGAEELGDVPSYSTVRRYMKAKGLIRRSGRRGIRPRPGDEAPTFVDREVRSFEMEHVNALWHLDFHTGKKKVLMQNGVWVKPILLAILDDCSRLCCHAQWYLQGDTCSLVQGYCQAIQKRGLPREQLNDNGGPMTSAEFVEGLKRLGIEPRRTLRRAPHQNGKQENWFGRVEGRLIPMLESVKNLSLRHLNEATQAWVEGEYNRKIHSEIGETPMDRFLTRENVTRDSPSTEELRSAFRMDVRRTIRRSDATVSIEGTRLEIPAHLRNLKRLRVRYARFDLGYVHIVDDRTGDAIVRIYPLDKERNADGRRRVMKPIAIDEDDTSREGDVAPLMKELMANYAATGLPFAYIPMDEDPYPSDHNQETTP